MKLPALSGVAELFADQFVKDRNAILHGSKHDYGQPKRSVIALLALYVIANEFVLFEKPIP